MKKQPALLSLGVLLLGGLALAQSPGQAPPPLPEQLTPQMLGEMLRSAQTFHELFSRLNLNQSLGPDQHVQGPDGRLHHSAARTASTVGAGVGAGAAIGAMTRNQNGVLIGALVGGMGGLVIDQVLKHREELRLRAIRDAANDPAYDPGDRELKFKERRTERP